MLEGDLATLRNIFCNRIQIQYWSIIHATSFLFAGTSDNTLEERFRAIQVSFNTCLHIISLLDFNRKIVIRIFFSTESVEV